MNKRERILNAALTVFMAKGGHKTTFGDIAKAAGISRPTLYAAFDDKDALLVAVIDHASSAMIVAAREAMIAAPTLADKLALFNDIMIMAPFQQIQQSEDAADILSGHNDAAKAAIMDATDKRALFLVEILTPYANGVDATVIHELAVTYTKAVSGLKNAVRSAQELQEALDGQAKMLQYYLDNH